MEIQLNSGDIVVLAFAIVLAVLAVIDLLLKRKFTIKFNFSSYALLTTSIGLILISIRKSIENYLSDIGTVLYFCLVLFFMVSGAVIRSDTNSQESNG